MLSKEQSAKEKRVQKLLQNPLFAGMEKKYAVDDTFVYDHSGRFQDYCDSMEKCKHCQGLCFCRQPLHGKYMELRVDGILVQELVNCSYQLQENSLFAHQKQYRLMDMPKQNLLVNISKLDLRNESMEYKHVVMQVLQKLMDEEDTKGFTSGENRCREELSCGRDVQLLCEKRVWCCFCECSKAYCRFENDVSRSSCHGGKNSNDSAC